MRVGRAGSWSLLERVGAGRRGSARVPDALAAHTVRVTILAQGHNHSLVPHARLLTRPSRPQDETLPCRDLVLVQKLARMPVQSLVLVVVRPADLLGALLDLPALLLTGSTVHASATAMAVRAAAATTATAGADSASHSAAVLASSMPSLGLYLTSPEHLARSALQGVIAEAREVFRVSEWVKQDFRCGCVLF